MKVEAGMVPWPKGKESEAGNRVDFSSLGENRRIFEITNLIIRQTNHHDFGNASLANHGLIEPHGKSQKEYEFVPPLM